MATATEKLEQVRARLRELDRALIAFSGGVDSTLLAHVAADVLGKRALIVTIVSPLFPDWEIEQARQLAQRYQWPYRVLQIDALAFEEVRSNPADRCYHCKTVLIGALKQLAAEQDFAAVCDGSNADDAADFRPGERALAEQGVVSPLREAGLTKLEIRALLKELGLPNWDKPAYACLATRVPHREHLSPELLRRIERAETVLHELGFRASRVRCHGDLARIEVDPERVTELAGHRVELVEKLRALGFRHVTLDLQGYQRGSFNEIPDPV